MSSLMPEIDRPWPTHLEPIHTPFGPLPEHYHRPVKHREQPTAIARSSSGLWRKTLVPKRRKNE